MPRQAQKLLSNQTIGVSRQVTAERLKKARVVVEPDMGLSNKRSSSDMRVPSRLTKSLAGTSR